MLFNSLSICIMLFSTCGLLFIMPVAHSTSYPSTYPAASPGEYYLIVDEGVKINTLEISESVEKIQIGEGSANDSGRYSVIGMNLSSGSGVVLGRYPEVYLIVDRTYYYFVNLVMGVDEVGIVTYEDDVLTVKDSILHKVSDKYVFPILLYKGNGILELVCPPGASAKLRLICDRHQPEFRGLINPH